MHCIVANARELQSNRSGGIITNHGQKGHVITQLSSHCILIFIAHHGRISFCFGSVQFSLVWFGLALYLHSSDLFFRIFIFIFPGNPLHGYPSTSLLCQRKSQYHMGKIRDCCLCDLCASALKGRKVLVEVVLVLQLRS